MPNDEVSESPQNNEISGLGPFFNRNLADFQQTLHHNLLTVNANVQFDGELCSIPPETRAPLVCVSKNPPNYIKCVISWIDGGASYQTPIKLSKLGSADELLTKVSVATLTISRLKLLSNIRKKDCEQYVAAILF